MTLADRWHSAILRNSLDVMRYDAHLRTEILAMLTELGRDLVRELAAAGMDTERTDWQRARLRELLKAVDARVSDAFSEISSHHAEGMAQAAEASSVALTAALNEAAGVQILDQIRWSAQQLAALVGNTLVEGAPSAEWWSRQAAGTVQAFADQMRMGMLRGESIGQLIGRVRDLLDTTARTTEALVRTSAMAVNNAAHLATYRENADVIAQLQWTATLDSRTCLRCGALDGERWPLGDAHVLPPLHWNCFVGGTVVESPAVLRGIERPYSGDVVVIRTAAGNEVTCTPNHPILTDSGWVAAGHIQEGQKVVQRLPGDGFLGTAPDAVKVKTRIEDVVGSLLGPGGMLAVAVPLTAEDFHGDARDHEVATVGANGELLGEIHPGTSEHVCESCLKIGSPSGLTGLSRLRRAGKGLEAGDAASGGDVRLPDEGAPLLGGGAAHADQHGLGAVPLGLAEILKPSHDDAPVDAQALRDRLDTLAALMGSKDGSRINHDAVRGPDGDARSDEVGAEGLVLLPGLIRETVERFPGLVAFDEVLEVRDRPGFVGHVYNLETEGNWYVASNIITHNCRCTTVPITKTWEQLAKKNKALAAQFDEVDPGVRASMGGPVSGDTTWESWLGSQPKAVQQDILGPARQKLWDAGKLTLGDLVDQRGNALTLAELKAR